MWLRRWLHVCALAVAAAASAPGAAARGAPAGAVVSSGPPAGVTAAWPPVGELLVAADKADESSPGSHSSVSEEEEDDDDDPGEHDHSHGQTHGLLLDLHDHNSIVAGMVVFTVFTILALVFTHLLHSYHITWLPESVVLIALGALLGLALRELYGIHSLQEYFGPINVIVLNVLLLPPIILESGWSLRRQDFLSQLEYIMVFAVGGTLISTFAICALLVWSGLIEEWQVAFTFSSLISATDPVATLATYSALQVEPLLNIMVFGESTINDAVAIVLFKAGNDMEFGRSVSGPKLAADMLTLLLGSPLVGMLVGALLVASISSLRMEESHGLCGLLVCVSAWFTYGLAELLGVSGIIATLFCSIILGAFLRPNLDPPMRDHVSMLLRHQAHIADMSVFMLVGVFVILLGHINNIGFSLSVAVFCLIGRALAIFPLGLLVNFVKRWRGRRAGAQPEDMHMLSRSQLVMMWHAGLRGGIAMALCLEINRDMMTKERKADLQEATFFCICLFLVVFGGTTQMMLGFLGIPMGVDEPEDALCKDRYNARGSSMVYSAARRLGSQGGQRLHLPRPTRTMSANRHGVELQGVGGLPKLSEEGEGEGEGEGRGSTDGSCASLGGQMGATRSSPP